MESSVCISTAAGLLAVVAFGLPCAAAPPPGADPALAPWFHDLKQPGTGLSCCDLSDCRTVVTRERDGKLQAYIDHKAFRNGNDQWIDVPEDVVLHGKDNPTGEPVACWYNYRIWCFTPASGT